MNRLSQLNETRQSILELCGSDAHAFLKNLVRQQPTQQQQRSQLISVSTDDTENISTLSSRSSNPTTTTTTTTLTMTATQLSVELTNDDDESIPDLANTDFEAVSNLSALSSTNVDLTTDNQATSQATSTLLEIEPSGLETSSSFDKYSLVEEGTTTANEESNLTSESAGTVRKFSSEKPPISGMNMTISINNITEIISSF